MEFESEISADGRQVYPAQYGESRYDSGVLDGKVFTQRRFQSEVTDTEDYTSASGGKAKGYMDRIDAYWNDIFKFLPYLGHSALGKSKWYFFHAGWTKAKSKGATKSIRDNMKKDKDTIIKEAKEGKKIIDDAVGYYGKIKAYHGNAKGYYDRAVVAKKHAQKSPIIPNTSKRLADKNANNAIAAYNELKKNWDEAQRLYKALKVDEIRKNAATQSWNLTTLARSIPNFSTFGDMTKIKNTLGDIEKSTRKDKSTLKKDSEDAERYSKKELGGRFWDKIKKFNPVLAGVRGLILLIVKLNIISMASKMNTLRGMAKTDEDKEASWKQIEYAWLRWGGSLSSFNKQIDIGKNKKPLGGKKSNFSGAEGPTEEPTTSSARGLQGAAVAAGGVAVAAAPPSAPFVAGAVPVIITILEIMADAGMFSKKELDDIAEGGAGEGGEATGDDGKLLGLPKKTVIIGGASVAVGVIILAVAAVVLKGK